MVEEYIECHLCKKKLLLRNAVRDSFGNFYGKRCFEKFSKGLQLQVLGSFGYKRRGIERKKEKKRRL